VRLVAVAEAEKILPSVVRLIENHPFQVIVSSQDYHPPSHVSFASRHKTEPFQVRKLPHPVASKAARGETIDQMMWPDHCLQGHRGSEFHSDIVQALERKEADGGRTCVVQKVSTVGGGGR
jgi:nicotinamidase/pyrazinamidase